MIKLTAFLFFIVLSTVLIAQTEYSMQGSFRVRNYTQKEYKANAQIFGISQATNGILYFANQRGVLQFDGSEWRTLILPNKMESFSTLSNGDDVLVGNTSGLGMFRKQDNGTFIFEDISEKYSDKKNPISNIQRYQNGYVISYLNVLYVLDAEFKVLNEYSDPDNSIGAMSVLNDVVYFRGKGNALFQYQDGIFTKLPEGSFFTNKHVVSILQFKDKMLFVTENDGVFAKSADGFFEQVFYDEKYSFKTAININNDLISLGSYVEGIVILDKDFTPVYSASAIKGLNDGTILYQFVDQEGNLWLGTSNGISKIDMLSPVMKFESLFKDATIEDINRSDEGIIIATGGGAYTISETGSIHKVDGIVNDCFGVQKLIFQEDTSLYISALLNVFKYRNGKIENITEGGPYNVKKSPINPNHLIVLHYDGIQLLEYRNGDFNEIKYLSGFCDGEPFNFVIQQDGTIWIGAKPNDGLYRMHLDGFHQADPSIDRFYTDQGLPAGQTYVFEYEDQIYSGTDKGLFKFEEGKFKPTVDFGVDFQKTGQGVHRINADPQGNVWMVLFKDIDNSYEIGFSSRNAETQQWEWHPEYFYSYDEYIIHSLFHQDENVTWLGGPGGLMSFDKRRIQQKSCAFDALIRLVKVGDSTIYGGNGVFSSEAVFTYDPKKLIEFKFTSNSFFAEEKTEYSYYLEGYDNTWSPWSSKNTKDYSLSEGSYVFRVKARNISGAESTEATFEFEVLPPWYRTWWAIFIFVILVVILVIGIVRLSLRRVKLQNIRLEKIVEERTHEVVAQKAEAEKQRDIAENQKHLVEEKNLEILDSINYAKRLQNAILTPVRKIQDTFNTSFIMYLPKDIVAGDFYWTNLAKENNRDDRSLIAAADCTGHGVPGAMVSVVCSNALDRAVKEFGLKNPGLILDKVTDLVIETFEQSEDEVKDGMDIALCSFEKGKNGVELQYSGANNPLWIVRSSSSLSVNDTMVEPIMEENGLYLFEIKATKQPVGKYAERRPFENNHIELASGDTVYTFTDGFADQFGGENGKKYKYLPFKRFVMGIQNLTMEEQQIALRQEFENWRGSYEQIDDVCVIGIRV